LDGRRGSRRDVAYQDSQLVIRRTSQPPGLRLTGAVDDSNVEAVGSLLDSTLRAHRRSDVHIDASELEFADVSGIRALVSTAERVEGGRHLILHGLPPLISKVISVVGWTDLPALTISDSDFPGGGVQPFDDTAE
jgi:anti-anti-sigma factor